MAKLILTLLLVTVFSITSLPAVGRAQSSTSTSGDGGPMGPRQQVATIIFAGLAGAILGLSTLSFYGRPQDKLSNIAVGFAVGIIIGTGYTTYKAATEPYRPYALELHKPWENERDLQLASREAVGPWQMAWDWSF